MTRKMFGPLVLLAASVSPSAAPAVPAAERGALTSVGRASAQATVSIRIISGVRFGADQAKEAPGADRRSAWLTDASGAARPAELLEFQ